MQNIMKNFIEIKGGQSILDSFFKFWSDFSIEARHCATRWSKADWEFSGLCRRRWQ